VCVLVQLEYKVDISAFKQGSKKLSFCCFCSIISSLDYCCINAGLYVPASAAASKHLIWCLGGILAY